MHLLRTLHVCLLVIFAFIGFRFGDFTLDGIFALVFRYTIACQINVHNVRISIDFNAFSCLQEKLSCLSWSTDFHDFGVV